MQAAIGCAQFKKLPAFIAARRKNAAFYFERLKQWEEHPEKHAAWLAEEGEDCYNGEGWAAGRSQDWGPSKLYDLCVAARESGEIKIRVSVDDFQEIHPFYRAKQTGEPK